MRNKEQLLQAAAGEGGEGSWGLPESARPVQGAAQHGEHLSRGAPKGPKNRAAQNCPVLSHTPGRWRPSSRDSWKRAQWRGQAMKQVSWRNDPGLPAPGSRTWTRWPPCSLRALSRTRLRAGSGGWNRCDARLHSSILGAGSTLQSAVHFLFQRERVCVLAEGGAEQPPRERASKEQRLSGPATTPAITPQGPAAARPAHRAQPPPAGRGSGSRLRSQLQGAPLYHRLHAPCSLGCVACAWPSLPPHLPTLPPPPTRKSPPGRYQTRPEPCQAEAASMQIWELYSHVPKIHLQQGTSGWEITCLVLC